MTNRRLPVWLMGLTNLSYGLVGGILVFALPQLLSERHVPEATIAAMTAVELSPGFWAFLLSPILDVRFSRRWYSVLLASIAAILLVIAMLNLERLTLVEVAITLSFFSAYLYQSALGGWLSTITETKDENWLSVWMTIGNVGGVGIMAIVCNQIVRHFSVLAAALILGAMVILPMAVFPWMQAPGPDRRLASESFPQFFGELVALVKQRQVLIAVIIFIMPCASFALTNFLAGLGSDYHASSQFVGLVAGAGVFAGGVVGCFLLPPLTRLLPLRPLYLAIGVAGSLFTLALIPLAHTPTSFAIAMIGENLFQALAITASFAIMFETVGRDNPLASTTFCFLGSAYGVPLTYMLIVDGAGYTRHGLAGSYAADAFCGLIASLLLGLLLFWLARRARTA